MLHRVSGGGWALTFSSCYPSISSVKFESPKKLLNRKNILVS